MQEEIAVVGIKYKKSSKVYYFNPRHLELKVGTEVLVDTVNGLAVGSVAMEKKYVIKKEIEEPLKNVVRVLTEKDKAQIEKCKKRAKDSYPIVEEKIKALNLTMNLTDIEYNFEETKVTISYTSDERVDFRELLKVLASTLRVKIELRQISTREEVKSVGALGLCGRECCCTKFLNEPAHVVVKMAKVQNLSMSPTKTGGACGRMMCCLSYEEPFYKEMQEKMPKVGSKIKTPDGEGVVQYNNLLKGIVTVKVFQSEDNYKVQDFSLVELGIEKQEEKPEEIKVSTETKEEQIKDSSKKVATNETKVYNDNVDKNVKLENQNVRDEQKSEKAKEKHFDKKKHFNHGGFKKKKFTHYKNNKDKKGDN